MIFIKAEGNWLERLKNRLLWKHTAYEVNERTRAYYHAPEAAINLKGIPLAKCGIKVTVTKKKSIRKGIANKLLNWKVTSNKDLVGAQNVTVHVTHK